MCFPSAARVTSTSVSEEKSPEKTDTRLDGWLFQRREKYWGPPLPPLPPPLLLAMLAAAAAAAAAAAEAFRRGMAVDLGGEGVNPPASPPGPAVERYLFANLALDSTSDVCLSFFGCGVHYIPKYMTVQIDTDRAGRCPSIKERE